MSNKAKKVEDVNIYDIYMKDIRRFGSVDGAKVQEYLNIYHNGNEKEKANAKEHIVGSLQRFVRSVANQYAHTDNLLDVISEGNIGLMTAIEKYDINSNVKFTTYAMYWVRKAILGYLTVSEPMVTPSNAIKLATYVPKIRQEFWNKNQRYPTTDELQDLLKIKHNLNFSNKEDLIPYCPMSIDEKYGEDEDGQEFMENNAYTSKTATCNTDSFVREHDNKIIVDTALSNLNERESYIIKCLYGIGCYQKSMDDVALEIGISYERVRQIATKSIDKLGVVCKTLIDAC